MFYGFSSKTPSKLWELHGESKQVIVNSLSLDLAKKSKRFSFFDKQIILFSSWNLKSKQSLCRYITLFRRYNKFGQTFSYKFTKMYTKA